MLHHLYPRQMRIAGELTDLANEHLPREPGSPRADRLARITTRAGRLLLDDHALEDSGALDRRLQHADRDERAVRAREARRTERADAKLIDRILADLR